MKESAKVTLYDIYKCGLYRLKKDESPTLGNLEEFLTQLQKWAKHESMVLANTCTYAPEGTDDTYKTYCYDILCNKNLVLLTTWNEIPKSQGNQILSVSSTATVGNATINSADIKKGDIPGYVTYFLFFLKENQLATINFDHSLNGRKNLEKYLTEFISKISSYAETTTTVDDEGNTHDQIVYKINEDDEPLMLTAYFETRLVRNKTNIALLIENFDSIRKIHKHNEIPFFTHESKTYWQKFSTFSNKKDDELKARYSLEMKYQPSTEDEIRTIIEDWEQNHKSTKWEDLGFSILGKSSPIWLSGTIARNDFELDIRRRKDEVVEPQMLLEQLSKIESSILKLKSE